MEIPNSTLLLFLAVNCTSPPPDRPGSGTWEWKDGSVEFGTEVTYTCGPYGNFQGGETGGKYDLVVSTCGWNRSWTPSTLDPCVATSCQVIPFPPPDIGMQHAPDEKNQITLESEFTFYNPRLPFTMNFPGPQFCGDNGDIMMIVGIIPQVHNLTFTPFLKEILLHFRNTQ